MTRSSVTSGSQTRSIDDSDRKGISTLDGADQLVVLCVRAGALLVWLAVDPAPGDGQDTLRLLTERLERGWREVEMLVVARWALVGDLDLDGCLAVADLELLATDDVAVGDGATDAVPDADRESDNVV